jgi:hypothetical protein
MSYEPPVSRQPGQPGFPPGAGQHAYPPPGQPGFPPPGQPGYTPSGQPGYTPPGQPGYTPSGQAGFTPSGQSGFPPPGQPGLPSQHGRPAKRGRRLAVVGAVILVIVVGLIIALVVHHNSSTALDPGCAKGNDAISKIAANPTPDQLPTVIAELNTAAGQAKSDDVRAAMQTLADDATKVLNDAKAQKAPDAAQLQKLTADGVAINTLCTVTS